VDGWERELKLRVKAIGEKLARVVVNVGKVSRNLSGPEALSAGRSDLSCLRRPGPNAQAS